MNISVIGTGYVGLVVGACLAETGNTVVCADVDRDKVEGLKRNQLPIYEPGLAPLVERNQQQGRLSFTNDVSAAIAYLESPEGGAVKSVFTVGFCFGGSSSWNQAALQPHVSGAIGFYGRPERTEPFISKMKAPLLMLIAGADFTPQEAFQVFDKELTAGNVSHEMHTYEGAPHSFFDRSFEQWKEACDDAWHRILAFVKKNG